MDSMSTLAILLYEIASGCHGPGIISQIRDVVISIAQEAERKKVEVSSQVSHLENEHTRVQQQQQNLRSSIQGLSTLAQQVADLASAGSAAHQASQ